MLILRVTYEQFEADGSHIGEYTLTPQEGNIEYPEATEHDIPKITHEFLKRAYGETIAETVYGKKQCFTLFQVEYKWSNLDTKKEKFRFLIGMSNYKEKFQIEG